MIRTTLNILLMVSNRALYFSSHWSSSYLGPRNGFSHSSPTGTAIHRSCYDTGRAFFPDTTLKTLSSTSASRRCKVNTSPTIKPSTILETGRSSEASESTPAPYGQHSPIHATEPQDKTSPSPRMKIGAGIGIGIGLGILILIALTMAILWFRRVQNHNQRKPTMNGLEREPKPSFEEDSAKSPRVRSDGISSQDLSWLADGRNISPETHNLPLCGPHLTVLNTTIPRTDDLKSSSASKLIKNSISSPGLLGDANRFLNHSVPMTVPGTLANEARSPVSPDENPFVFFPNVPPSPEEIFPPNTRQAHSSVDLDPPPTLAAKKSHEFFLPISQQESKDPSASSLIILDSPQSITPEERSGGVRAHLRDNPQQLRSNSSASRGTLADPPNHREANIANNSPGSNSTAVGPTTTVKDSLDAKNDSPATIQNFSRKIGSLRQGRDSGS